LGQRLSSISPNKGSQSPGNCTVSAVDGERFYSLLFKKFGNPTDIIDGVRDFKVAKLPNDIAQKPTACGHFFVQLGIWIRDNANAAHGSRNFHPFGRRTRHD
jgi:hypothetical protein